AVRHNDRWLTVSTFCRLHLSGTPQPAPVRYLPVTKNVLAVAESMPIATLPRYLVDVARGERQIGGEVISFVRGLVWPNTNTTAGYQTTTSPSTWSHRWAWPSMPIGVSFVATDFASRCAPRVGRPFVFPRWVSAGRIHDMRQSTASPRQAARSGTKAMGCGIT